MKVIRGNPLRKHAHAIYRDVFQKQKIKISLENFDFLNIFTQNIHYGYTLELPRRGGSNESQCMFLIKNKKIRHSPRPANPSFSM